MQAAGIAAGGLAVGGAAVDDDDIHAVPRGEERRGGADDAGADDEEVAGRGKRIGQRRGRRMRPRRDLAVAAPFRLLAADEDRGHRLFRGLRREEIRRGGACEIAVPQQAQRLAGAIADLAAAHAETRLALEAAEIGDADGTDSGDRAGGDVLAAADDRVGVGDEVRRRRGEGRPEMLLEAPRARQCLPCPIKGFRRRRAAERLQHGGAGNGALARRDLAATALGAVAGDPDRQRTGAAILRADRARKAGRWVDRHRRAEHAGERRRRHEAIAHRDRVDLEIARLAATRDRNGMRPARPGRCPRSRPGDSLR